MNFSFNVFSELILVKKLFYVSQKKTHNNTQDKFWGFAVDINEIVSSKLALDVFLFSG